MPDQLDDQLVPAGFTECAGEDDKSLATRIPEQLFASLQNMVIGAPGRLTGRKGLDDQGSFAETTPVRALGRLQLANGTRRIMAVCGQSAYSWDGSTKTSLYSSLTGDLQTVIFNVGGALNTLMILNGTDTPKDWDGTTFTSHGSASTDPPNGHCGIFTSNGRILIAKGNKYYWSSTNPSAIAGAFDTANSRALPVEKIMGMVEWTEGEVLMFGPRSIFIVNITDTTPTNWTQKKVDSSVGCIAYRSPIIYAGAVWFYAQDGLRVISQGDTNSKRADLLPLSDPIKTDYIDLLTGSMLDRIWTYSYDGVLYVGVPYNSNSYLTRLLTYDHRVKDKDGQGRGGWSPWTVAAECAIDIDFNGQPALYFGASSNAPKLNKYTGTSDNGVAIEFSATTKRFDFGALNSKKVGDFVEVEALAGGTGILYLEAAINGGGFSFLETTDGDAGIDLSDGAIYLPATLPLRLAGGATAKGKFSLTGLGEFDDIQFRLTMSDLDQPATITRLTAWAFINNLDFSS